ncbi:hypothetical protein OID55_41605 (plasmid) [Streptomyces sp. NBC_00715]|uniref:hypothetical protein n=1 Tax=Streptomyces sp. NBC_00715 TaxID=2975811 RepID=UPI002F90B159
MTAIAALITGALAMYTLLHHKQVFAWMQKVRRKDQANAELDKPDQWLSDLYTAQCRLARKPCQADDFEDIPQTNNMIKGVVDHTETIRADLSRVVKRVEEYLPPPCPDPDPDPP